LLTRPDREMCDRGFFNAARCRIADRRPGVDLDDVTVDAHFARAREAGAQGAEPSA